MLFTLSQSEEAWEVSIPANWLILITLGHRFADYAGIIVDEPHHKVRRAPVNEKLRFFEGVEGPVVSLRAVAASWRWGLDE